MLFKPDLNETAKAASGSVARVAGRARRRTVSIFITLLILGGLGYIGWTSFQQKQQAANRARPDLAVPVLAATPRIQDVPVYLEGVGSVRALNNVLVRAQVDGKLIAVNFIEGQDVRKGDILGEIVGIGRAVGGGGPVAGLELHGAEAAVAAGELDLALDVAEDDGRLLDGHLERAGVEHAGDRRGVLCTGRRGGAEGPGRARRPPGGWPRPHGTRRRRPRPSRICPGRGGTARPGGRGRAARC